MNRISLPEKVSLKHTALIIIDIQRDFCASDGVLARRGRDVSAVNRVIDKLESLIDAATSRSILTLYSQQIYDRKKLNALQLEQYDSDNKLVTCDIDSNGYKFYRIQPPLDRVFPKYNYNIFSNLELVRMLEDRGIKTLVITGTDTVYCVETAIRNGFDLGYKIVVPQDLIFGNPKHDDWNKRTLDLVTNTYGVVTNSSELIEMWKAEAAAA